MERTRSTGIGVDALYYRAQNDDHLDLLDKLERTGLLRKELDKYLVSLYGLTLLDDEQTKTLMGNIEKLFSILKSHYKAQPRAKLMVAELARMANLSYKETAECLSYMVQAHWTGTHTSVFDNPAEAFISASETILRYKDFKELVAEVIRLQIQREESAQSTREWFHSDLQQETHQGKDIFLLRPSFFGIGIDLKALWKRLRNRSR